MTTPSAALLPRQRLACRTLEPEALFARWGKLGTRVAIILHAQMLTSERAAARLSLRQATAAAHRALESSVGALNSVAAYVVYLRGLSAFRAPTEKALGAALQTTALAARLRGWRPTWIADTVEQDRVHLRVPAIVPEPAPEALADPAAALGACYVLEGSGLGARVLLTRAKALGLGAETGARHLWRQADALENWRAFLAALGAPDDYTLARAADGANADFACAQRAMERARHA